MPEFSNPCECGNCTKDFSKEGIIRAIRFNIAAEYEAIQLYEQIAESTNDKKVKKVLYEVIEDEKTHAGCFLELLKMLSPAEFDFYKCGEEEVKKILKEN